MIVANPKIADVTVVDANTLFITGKGYGVTEVVAVDAVGRPLFQSQVVVSAGSAGSVRVWRGAQATEMACGTSCSPSVQPPRRQSMTGPVFRRSDRPSLLRRRTRPRRLHGG